MHVILKHDVECTPRELGVPAMEPHTTFNVKGIVKVDVPTSNINKFGDLYWST